MHARMLPSISSADSILAYCLNPWARVLFVQASFSRTYGRCITAFTHNTPSYIR